MIPIVSLWLPILLSAILVFVGSSVIHMFLNWHKNDFSAVPDEDATMDALRPFAIPAGDYIIPFAGGSDHLRSDEFKAKVEKGPVAVMTVFGPGDFFNMGPQLAQWFAYAVVVAAFAAYVATRTLTFACYAMALPQRSIWWKQGWGSTLRSMADGFVYACLTAGAFGWRWP